MSVSHVLMGLLARRAGHGYELKKEHDACFPEARPLAFGQVYATLERLAGKGYVRAIGTARVDGPDRTSYELTPEGRAELAEWLDEIEEPSPFVANPLAVKATVALLVANRDTAAAYLNRQRAAHLDRMRHYTRIKTDRTQSTAAVLAADFALMHLDADLRWLQVAHERVTTLEQEVTP